MIPTTSKLLQHTMTAERTISHRDEQQWNTSFNVELKLNRCQNLETQTSHEVNYFSMFYSRRDNPTQLTLTLMNTSHVLCWTKSFVSSWIPCTLHYNRVIYSGSRTTLLNHYTRCTELETENS